MTFVVEFEAICGEDVPVYAGGPGAELVHGVVEESSVFQVMNHALGFDERR